MLSSLSPSPSYQSYTGQPGGGGGGGGGGGTASGNGAGDEDYEIPPITPPNHPEPPLLHLMEHDSTGYLCHSLPHNGLINPYSYPELPALMMSNMLAQDSHLLSSQMPSITGEKRPSSEMMKPKPKPQKRRRRRTPTSPRSPWTESNATFGDVSKIVASMWDGLGEEQKQGYKRKTEAAKKEYLKALAAYRATYNDPVETKSAQTSQPSPHMMPANPPLYSVPPPPQPSSPYLGPGAFPLTDLQSYAGHAPRHTLSRTLSQSQMLPSISPPLHPHQQLSLHQSSLLNQPIRMQPVQSQPIISHQMGLQASLHSPPPGQQSFSHLQSEYQKSVGGSQSPGAPGPGPRSGPDHDWDSEYCNRECGNHCRSLGR
uniref:TOX high mobility group box family member 2 n=1 Tax=Myripristis murdjan TaxID=586833 RepID=A0A667Y7C9_9TELE